MNFNIKEYIPAEFHDTSRVWIYQSNRSFFLNEVLQIEEMMKQKLNLGGEQSGHIIFRDFTTTGDGIISALQILRIMHQTAQPLSKLKTRLEKYPQAQRNVLVKEKPPLAELPTVMKLVDEAEKELSGKGRVLLRYSGTESKIRLLIEGRELDKIDKQANRIAEAIEHAIGAN